MTLTGENRSTPRKKPVPVPIRPPQNPTWTDLGWNAGLRGERQTTNHLNRHDSHWSLYEFTAYANVTLKGYSKIKLHRYILHHHHHHHHISVMELGHLFTRSGFTYPEVSSKVYHDSLCQQGSSISLPWLIYFVAFYLHVVSSFSCIPAICPQLVLFLTPLQFVHLFCNLSKCILLFFSCISSLLLLFFWRHLL